FHLGGADETMTMARLAGIGAEHRVLDVGGGIGGPARMLAQHLGCDVTVLDLCAEYCDVGRGLTRRAGLGDRVRFQTASALAMPFADATFTAGWTQHSSMNIADKVGLYGELHRVLAPGAKLSIHEVMAGPAGRCTSRCRGPGSQRSASSADPTSSAA
ncbi:MAG: methyltransferase domain-containing protein, partial [Planctomycetes bacterium]|nr:methyltransferase domain-containing protein [Planctomycetota bacterium]